MIDLNRYPVLNNIEIIPVRHRNKKLISLRNPEHTEVPPLVVSELTLHILQFFDGKHSLKDIIRIFLKDYNVNLDTNNLSKLIEQLDDSMLLDSENYKQYLRKVENRFLKQSSIECSHTDICYPGEKEALIRTLDEYYNRAGEATVLNNANSLAGIVSPHIDFYRGWQAYVKAYRNLRNIKTGTFIIFGTSHYAKTSNPYILTKKSFDTPLGKTHCDTEIVSGIDRMCDWDVFDGETSYRSEHSVEFQIIFLQHILGADNDFRVVPVLCNSFSEYIEKGLSPASDPRVSKFIEVLKDVTRNTKKNIFYIAGVDLTHYGRKFGDDTDLDSKTLEWINDRDKVTLDKIKDVDPEGFYFLVEKEKDERKICGLSSIYTLLSVTSAGTAQILDYDMAVEQNSQSVVTYASAALFN